MDVLKDYIENYPGIFGQIIYFMLRFGIYGRFKKILYQKIQGK